MNRHGRESSGSSPLSLGGFGDYYVRMAICKACQEEVDELVTVTIDGRRQRVCEDCAEQAEQDEQMARDSEAAIQQMMGFKGRR